MKQFFCVFVPNEKACIICKYYGFRYFIYGTLCKSFIYIMFRRGPKIDPSGTPQIILALYDGGPYHIETSVEQINGFVSI